MGAYDGANFCEIVGLFLLNNLANKFDKYSFGLYRDGGFVLFTNINRHCSHKIRKEFHQHFRENGLSLEIVCNIRTANCLDITLNLDTGTKNHIPNVMIKHFMSTQNPITQQIFSNSYLYQLKLGCLTIPAIRKFSMKHLNIIKIS